MVEQHSQSENSEDLIKSNKSMAQQNMDLQQQITDLKLQLIRREATIQGISNILNSILNLSEAQANKIHKELQKNISALTDVVGDQLNKALEKQFHTLDNMAFGQQQQLSNMLRSEEGLPPLIVSEKQDINKSKK